MKRKIYKRLSAYEVEKTFLLNVQVPISTTTMCAYIEQIIYSEIECISISKAYLGMPLEDAQRIIMSRYRFKLKKTKVLNMLKNRLRWDGLSSLNEPENVDEDIFAFATEQSQKIVEKLFPELS